MMAVTAQGHSEAPTGLQCSAWHRSGLAHSPGGWAVISSEKVSAVSEKRGFRPQTALGMNTRVTLFQDLVCEEGV